MAVGRLRGSLEVSEERSLLRHYIIRSRSLHAGREKRVATHRPVSFIGDNCVMAMPSAPSAARTVSPYLLLTLTPFFWACNWILGRGLSTSIPPIAMTFYRWLFAILILAPFAWPHLKREWPIVRRHRRVLLLLEQLKCVRRVG